jgi:hypothetical protein
MAETHMHNHPHPLKLPDIKEVTLEKGQVLDAWANYGKNNHRNSQSR